MFTFCVDRSLLVHYIIRSVTTLIFKGDQFMNVQQQFKDVFQPDVTRHPEYRLGQFHRQNDIPVKPSACVEYYLGYEAPCATSKVINEAKGNE